MFRLVRRVILAAAAGCAAAAVFFGGPFVYSAYREAKFELRDLDYPRNTVFYGRNGKVLRFLPNGRGERQVIIDGGLIPKTLKDAFIAAEDERFYTHRGYDIAAIVRAAQDNVRAGRIVSGASTISQQLIRLSRPRGRDLHEKLVEVFLSIELETRLSKDEILEKYLNRVPLGNNIVGVELASRQYFGKSCRDLSPAECALLASLPKAPTFLNPLGDNRGRLMARRDWVLGRMKELGLIDGAVYAEALRSHPDVRQYSFPFEAPHFVDLLIKRGAAEEGGPFRTTLDLELQHRVEKILASHRARLGKRGAVQAAAMVIHNPTMEALSMAGSVGYRGSGGGMNNGVTSLRSGGSTLKPFLYALALEKGHTASEIIQDTERKYRSPGGTYTPANFDRNQYGPVTVRLALGGSLNLSAVRMLEEVGCNPFYNFLERINLINLGKGPDYYGLGLAVGNPEVSLEELVRAYAMLAAGGEYRPVKYVIGSKKETPGVRVLEPQTAYIITDILSDPSARSVTFGASLALEFPFKVALKTGTSTNYRDCWAIGYTPEYTIGVWVGNFDGRSTQGFSGSTAAVPIFYEVLDTLYEGGTPGGFRKPEGVVTASVCGHSGMKPSPGCTNLTDEIFIAGTEPAETCSFHANGGGAHELPAPYAGWVYDKARKGSAGSFKIASLPDDFYETAFSQVTAGEDSPVRLRGIRVPPAKAASEAKKYHISSVTERHYEGGNALQITYPLNGDRFLIDSYAGGQTIMLSAISESPVEYIDWFIDGEFLQRARPPYNAYWELKKGRHRLMAVDPMNNGAVVNLWVE